MKTLEILQSEKYNKIREIEALESKIDTLTCKILHIDMEIEKLELIEPTDEEMKEYEQDQCRDWEENERLENGYYNDDDIVPSWEL